MIYGWNKVIVLPPIWRGGLALALEVTIFPGGMKGMPRLIGYFGSVLGVYGLVLVGLYSFQRSLLYVPPGQHAEIALSGRTDLQVVETTTQDGLTLEHWYRPPAEPDGPVILLFHGNAGHIGDRVPKYRAFYEAGFGVFSFEYRGYNGNPGRPSEALILTDVEAALSFLAEQGFAPERIVLYGESLGTGVAVKLASDRQYAGIVLEAPYSSIAEVAQHHYWYVPAYWLIHDKWNSVKRIASVQSPLLVLIGELDRTVPPQFSRKLYETAPGPKETIVLPRSGHTEFYDFPEVPERVVAFVREKAG